jgi:heat shock protein HtpX
MINLDEYTWQRHALLNRLQSLLLLAVMFVFTALLGWLLWGISGILMLLFSLVVLIVINPMTTPQLIMRLYRAGHLHRNEAPGLYAIIDTLSDRAGLSHPPDLYYVPSRMINAFTVGRRQRAAIAVTDGLLQALDTRETIAVLAHELSHVRSDDIWVMGLADMFSRMTSLLSMFGQILLLVNLPLILVGEATISWLAILVLIFAPTLSLLAQLGLSRTREYDADLNAVRLTGDPDALASALAKIERIQGGWLERIFLPGRRIPDPSMLRSHPPTEERIKRLLSLKRSAPEMVSMLPEFDMHRPRTRIRRAPGWHIGGLWH